MKGSSLSLRLWIFFSLLSLSLCPFHEVTVTCVYGHSCVLPCSFISGHDLIIAWTKIEGGLIVHDYHKGQSQLQQQHEDYRGRTALYEDEITKGNASLLLREVRVQDEGTYECLTINGALRATVVRLRVTAPVVGLSLEQSRGRLLCGAEGIYPRPAVTWTFSPGPPDTPQTTVTSFSETGLFSVNSSVPLTLSSPPHEYSCSVSTEHSWRSATYRTNPPVSVSDCGTVPCTEPTAPLKTLLWRFNHRETILTKTGSELLYTESWTPFVIGLTESNSLVLKDLTQDQLGLFSCELSTETEEFIINTELTKKRPSFADLVLLVICLILMVVWAALTLYLHIRDRKKIHSLEQQLKDKDNLLKPTVRNDQELQRARTLEPQSPQERPPEGQDGVEGRAPDDPHEDPAAVRCTPASDQVHFEADPHISLEINEGPTKLRTGRTLDQPPRILWSERWSRTRRL